MTISETRWLAVRTRNAAFDGKFVYGVSTTGIYCRPACPSRLPLRRNVEFYDTGADAAHAGLRPCRRCSPQSDSPAATRREALERIRELLNADPDLSLDAAAQMAGLSRFHFHRVFREAFGVTFARHARQVRLRNLREELRSSISVTDAVYAAGFNSSAQCYNSAGPALGMTPGQYRRAGRGLTIEFATAQCSLGTVLVATTPRGVCSIALGDSRPELIAALRDEFSAAEIGQAADAALARAVADSMEHPGQKPEIAFDATGTEFQHKVWDALTGIPPGRTISYSELARSIGRPSAVRAVARACATNPLAVVVPCHRVVGANGSLSGYRWGLERKRLLLEREAAV